MFATIYYFLGLFVLLNEANGVINPVRRFAKSQSLNSIRGKEYNDLTKEQKQYISFTILYVIWVIIGVAFTSNWPLFCLILLFVLIPKQYLLTLWIDAVLSFAVLFVIMVNGLHLHIDVYAYLKTLILQ